MVANCNHVKCLHSRFYVPVQAVLNRKIGSTQLYLVRLVNSYDTRISTKQSAFNPKIYHLQCKQKDRILEINYILCIIY